MKREISTNELATYAHDFLHGDSLVQIAEVNHVPVGRVRRALAEASRRLAPRTRNRKDLTPDAVREAVEAAPSLAQAARNLGTTPRTLRLRLQGGPPETK